MAAAIPTSFGEQILALKIALLLIKGQAHLFDRQNHLALTRAKYRSVPLPLNEFKVLFYKIFFPSAFFNKKIPNLC